VAAVVRRESSTLALATVRAGSSLWTLEVAALPAALAWPNPT